MPSDPTRAAYATRLRNSLPSVNYMRRVDETTANNTSWQPPIVPMNLQNSPLFQAMDVPRTAHVQRARNQVLVARPPQSVNYMRRVEEFNDPRGVPFATPPNLRQSELFRPIPMPQEIGANVRVTPEYQLGAAIARGLIMGGFTQQRDMHMPNQMRSNISFAQDSYGAQYTNALQMATAGRHVAIGLATAADVFVTGYEAFGDVVAVTGGEPISTAIGTLGVFGLNLLAGPPGLADAVRTAAGPALDRNIERAAENLENLSNDYMFFVLTRARYAPQYNAFLQSRIDYIESLDFSDIPNGGAIKDYAIWFIEKIIEANRGV